MKSTADFPFRYFEHYLANSIFDDLKIFYTRYDNNIVENRIKQINKEKHFIELYKDSYSDGELEYDTFTFKKIIFTKLNSEILKAQDFIELGIQKRFSDKNELKGYVDFLNVKLNNLVSLKAFWEFDFLSLIIDGFRELIHKHSNQTVNYKSVQAVNLIIESNDENLIFKYNVGEEKELIDSIFGFMNGNNEKQEKIMSGEQFNMLIKYISDLVEKQKLPIITSKLDRVNISNDLLSFSFWVLHKELYTTKRLRYYFFDFLKCTFSNYGNTELASIQSGFGSKSRVYKDSFVPEIIKQYI